MVICFSASESAKQSLDLLMATGSFKSVSEAVSMALTNYAVIQQAVEREGHTIVPSIAALKSAQSDTKTKATPATLSGSIPDLFRIAHSMPSEGLFAPSDPPTGKWQDLTPKDWLWGQYNRFLPAKLTCRGILQLLGMSPHGLSLEAAASRISEAASILGDILSQLDHRYGRRREEAFSAALPSMDASGVQGRVRFSNQFVGTLRQGKLLGLPAGLRLLTVGRKEAEISLTSQGLRFAMLPSPVLDDDIQSVTRPISPTEVDFLLEHLLRFVPEETSAYATLIEGVDQQNDTPERLDRFLRRKFNLKDESVMTSSFLATQRTGAVSRMVELGLLRRQKEGLHVKYEITEVGKKFCDTIV